MSEAIKKFENAIKELSLPPIYFEIAKNVLVRDSFKAKYVYGFGETKDNIASVLTAIENYNSDSKILMPNHLAICGSASFNYCSNWLKERGKACESISPRKAVNTYTESKTIMDYMDKNHLHEISIIASEFHQLRAFWSLVSCIKQKCSSISVYNYLGNPLPWDEEVVHSQGTLRATRENLIASELERIVKYQKKGDLVNPKEIWNYIVGRE